MQTISHENVVHLSNGEIEACLKNLNSQTRRTDIVRLVAFLLLNFSQIREYQNSHFGGTSTISKLTRSFRTMTFHHLPSQRMKKRRELQNDTSLADRAIII